MRELDRLTATEFATPTLLLMEAAAEACVDEIVRCAGDLPGKNVLILCGEGNNGGDGAAIARILVRRKIAHLDCVLLGRLTNTIGDARINFEIVKRLAAICRELRFHELADNDFDSTLANLHLDAADIIVDALFGTGLARPPAGVHKRSIEWINDQRRARDVLRESANDVGSPLVISVDLPSGLAADTAVPPGVAVAADLTVTFTAPKLANVLPPASRYNGRLVVRSVGTPDALAAAAASRTFVAEATDARAWLRRTRLAPGTYKNRRGHVLVIAGSRDMSGAAVLASGAALAAGAGLVTLATPVSAHSSIAARAAPEIMVASLPEDAERGCVAYAGIERVRELAARADVIAIGPGLTDATDDTRRLIREIVQKRHTPIIIDADALNALAPWDADLCGTTDAPLILTPHEGEMRRLLGVPRDAAAGEVDPLADRIGAARLFADTHKVFLVLKGERTIIAAPDGRVCINPTGNAGLAKGGSGDTLTGIIASLVAQTFASGADDGADDDDVQGTFETIVAALYIAGAAADHAAAEQGLRSMTPSDVRAQLGAVFRRLDPAGEQA